MRCFVITGVVGIIFTVQKSMIESILASRYNIFFGTNSFHLIYAFSMLSSTNAIIEIGAVLSILAYYGMADQSVIDRSTYKYNSCND